MVLIMSNQEKKEVINQVMHLLRCGDITSATPNKDVWKLLNIVEDKKPEQEQEDVVRCWCYSKNGEPHCPLTTDEQDLKRYFNYFLEDIVWVDIDKSFVCHEERKEHCKNCPFK